MCGIAGYAGLPRSPEQMRADLQFMCDAIRHRGPDDAGYYVDEGVALGMRRLSIIDLATGRQPIHNEDGRVTIVFNGEIYNYRELHERLRARGHRFRTVSDTESIVHLYEESGPELVHELNGMFGFALWDESRRRLLLARDRLGIKPLYYWPTDGGVAFASELKSLLTLDEFTRDVDPQGMAYFLALGYVPAPHTIYRGVKKLEPGEYLTWDRDRGVEVHRYWSPIVEEDPGLGAEEAIRLVQETLEDAVRLRLVSDVPLGAFLSGGIDSSTVVGTMSRLMDEPVKTFSIGFEEPEFNEADDARLVSDALGTDHTQLIVRPDVDALIERVATSFDEPFADASAIPTFLVSELARRDVTVSLSGDGGDELFGGYLRYRSAVQRNTTLPGAATGIDRGADPPRAARHVRPEADPGIRADAPRSLRGPRGLPARSGARRRGSTRDLAVAADAGRRAGSVVRPGGNARLRGPAHARRCHDVPPGRYPHEGRPHVHGGLSRGTGAAPRPSNGRVGGTHPDGPQGARGWEVGAPRGCP